MRNKYILLFLLFISLIACTKEEAPLEVPSIFTDHMVIQRDADVLIWGTTSPGVEVTVSSSWGASKSTEGDELGHWKVSLEGVEAGGPHTLKIANHSSSIEIDDILSGEVWLASGQSNMEMPVKGWPPNDTINYSSREIASADYPDIRMFTVQRNMSALELEDVQGEWETSNPENTADFSATAYFFARELYRELNVPIGIIHSSWGGTPAESWVSRSSLEELGDFNETLELLGQAAALKAEADAWEQSLEQTEIGRMDITDVELDDAPLKESEFDDQNWATATLPAFWEAGDLKGFDGIVWFRKKILFDKDPNQTYELRVGAIDDMDITYVNGIEVGRTLEEGKYSVERTYTIPSGTLVNGENTIAIKVFDGGGGGGIYTGVMSLDDISLAGEWQYMPVAEYRSGKLLHYGTDGEALARRPDTFGMLNQNTPSVLYNAMIAPIIEYAFRGAIWYQGESNVGRAAQYERLFPGLISDWRELNGTNFPFYYVQIAPYTYGGDDDPASAELRDAQRKTLELDNTGMVVTMDIGNVRNIHPSNKQDVGIRLALIALANTYELSGIEYSGPLPIAAEVYNDGVLVSFSNIASGLILEDGGSFELAGDDGSYYEAKAGIEGDQLFVKSPQVDNPTRVRYAFKNVTDAYLFNGAGLPATSFEISITK